MGPVSPDQDSIRRGDAVRVCMNNDNKELLSMLKSFILIFVPAMIFACVFLFSVIVVVVQSISRHAG